ncbi:MAG: hypothetical protein Q8R36_04725 [bacterium]|nr:hypothetical protein [bacterium]
MDANNQHPELRKGEIFLTNCIPDEMLEVHEIFASIGWKTKRLGEQSYDVDGKSIHACRPVFILKSELDEAGVTLDF